MQTQQHQNVAAGYSGSNATPGAVVIHSTGPAVYRPQVPKTRPTVLRFATAHMVFGVIQMLVGGLCFLLDVVAVCLATSVPRFGAGIYSGIFFFVAGLLGFLAGRYHSTCCVVGCMVLNIIASCVAVIGMSFASIEISSTAFFYDSADHKTYIHNKSVFVLCACIFEFIFTIVHSSLTCASCCYCCMPRTTVAEPNDVITTTTVLQGTNQQQMYYPNQQGYYPQHTQQMQPQAMAQAYPQQMHPQTVGQAYPQAVGPAVPPYPVQSASYPQQGNLPYNPAFSPDSSYPEQPPSYSAAVDYKQA